MYVCVHKVVSTNGASSQIIHCQGNQQGNCLAWENHFMYQANGTSNLTHVIESNQVFKHMLVLCQKALMGRMLGIHG